jgi:hypothetical protein
MHVLIYFPFRSSSFLYFFLRYFSLPLRLLGGNKALFEIKGKKGKAVPLQAWSDPDGSRKLRFPYFVITAQDGGKFVILTHRPPLPPGNTPGTHLF